MSYLSAFSPYRDPLLFQKLPCHLVVLVKDSAILNVSFLFGTILLRVSFTYQRPTCMYNYPINSSSFCIKMEQQRFPEPGKTLCRIHIALCTVSSILAHIFENSVFLFTNALVLLIAFKFIINE